MPPPIAAPNESRSLLHEAFTVPPVMDILPPAAVEPPPMPAPIEPPSPLLSHEAFTVPPEIVMSPAGSPWGPPMPAADAEPAWFTHFAVSDPSPETITDAGLSSNAPDASSPARKELLTREFSLPSANMMFALAPNTTLKAQPSWLPL